MWRPRHPASLLSSFSGNGACPATKRLFRCSTRCAPAWCDRSATLSDRSIRSKWMRRLLAVGQRARDTASTIRRRSLGPLRYAHGKPPKRAVCAGRWRLRLVPNRGAKTLTGFVQDNVAKGAVVRTDGWHSDDDLTKLGYSHEPVVIDGAPERTDAHLPMIHIAFSNLTTWLLGTHHGVSHQHLPAYLNEFVFRFNRRFYPMTAFNSALGLAAHASAPTYEMLYSGKWTHPIT